MTPARKAALLRLLEDWEAGRDTSAAEHPREFSSMVQERLAGKAYTTHWVVFFRAKGYAAAMKLREGAE